MLKTFVALAGGRNAMVALGVLRQTKELPCNTWVLHLNENFEGFGEQDVVLATYTGPAGKGHWPSRWLRTQGKYLPEMLPDWAKGASNAIVIKPRTDIIGSPGFEAAVLQAAAAAMEVKPLSFRHPAPPSAFPAPYA